MKAKYLCPVLLFSLVSGPAFAQGIPIEPGLWEMTSTMSMPMLPMPKVSTNTECIEESELSPESMNEGDMDPSCTFDTRQVDGNTMKWSMNCSEGGGASHGEWEATSHGDTLTGAGTVTVDMQGHSMAMNVKWDGKRIGDCD